MENLDKPRWVSLAEICQSLHCSLVFTHCECLQDFRDFFLSLSIQCDAGHILSCNPPSDGVDSDERISHQGESIVHNQLPYQPGELNEGGDLLLIQALSINTNDRIK